MDPVDTAGRAVDAFAVAPQSTLWHDLTIVAIAWVAVLNAAAIVGLLVAERFAAHVIHGHTPTWGLVGNACYGFGMVVTEIICGVILVRASRAQ